MLSPSAWAGSARRVPSIVTRLAAVLADPRLAPRPATRDGQEVADDLQAAHAVEDGDVEQAVGRVGVGEIAKPEPVVRAVADGDRRAMPVR